MMHFLKTGCLVLLFSLQGTAFAQEAETSTIEYHKGTVLSIETVSEETIDGISYVSESVTVEIHTLPSTVTTIDHNIVGGRADMKFSEGDKAVVQLLQAPGRQIYSLQEHYRLPNITLLIVLFVIAGFIIGGKTGITSLLGLALSIAILVFIILPLILQGINPILVTTIGSFAIAVTSLFIAHGINKRTWTALYSTLLTLAIAIGLALGAVYFTRLFGSGEEEALFLQFGSGTPVDLRGIFLAGIILGTLGVLDDITTAQTAAIDEIAKANPSLSPKQLYASGVSIGREHIASLINTLALAYAGSSLPILLLFSIDSGSPWWVTLNTAFISEEIVRTLIGSTALLFAVPISTFLAAKRFSHGGYTSVTHGHHHH